MNDSTMKTLTYAPQCITADELNAAIEFDTCFIVNDDGTVENSGNHAPDVWGCQGQADPDVSDEGWEFFSRGYTGQHGYSGPEMHQSEFLGGRLAEDILTTPGEYALAIVYYECDEDCQHLWPDGEESCGDMHIESWVVLNRV